MPHERSAQRVDQANGYKSKTMLTRMGEITFEVPQVRSGGVLPQLGSLGWGESAWRICVVWITARAPGAHANHQGCGAPEQGDQT